ncbi:hypothetical protein M5K25_025405 [Dendrobium thyrsiflorum]|uniref:Uncharacterized protein n=1 Tax=Dendrobium thyrsiflorum TaxID=117978 RepID=A0ABD0U954_DENTH
MRLSSSSAEKMGEVLRVSSKFIEANSLFLLKILQSDREVRCFGPLIPFDGEFEEFKLTVKTVNGIAPKGLSKNMEEDIPEGVLFSPKIFEEKPMHGFDLLRRLKNNMRVIRARWASNLIKGGREVLQPNLINQHSIQLEIEKINRLLLDSAFRARAPGGVGDDKLDHKPMAPPPPVNHHCYRPPLPPTATAAGHHRAGYHWAPPPAGTLVATTNCRPPPPPLVVDRCQPPSPPVATTCYHLRTSTPASVEADNSEPVNVEVERLNEQLHSYLASEPMNMNEITNDNNDIDDEVERWTNENQDNDDEEVDEENKLENFIERKKRNKTLKN